MEHKLYFEVHYELRNFKESFARFIPGLEELMKKELMDTHNIYAKICNSDEGYSKLNKKWDELHPNYFEENKGKDWTELVEYNNYIRTESQNNYVAWINKGMPENIMTYKLGDELQLIGCLKIDPKVEIEFWVKEAKI